MNLKKLIENSEYFVWLALGDSITEYNHCTEGYDNYLQHFDQLLRDAYSRRKYTIINSAVSGSSLSDDANFAIDKIRRFKPPLKRLAPFESPRGPRWPLWPQQCQLDR